MVLVEPYERVIYLFQGVVTYRLGTPALDCGKLKDIAYKNKKHCNKPENT